MRVGVLGGCGDMGSRAVEVLATSQDVTEVVVFDRDTVRGKELARQPGVTFEPVDATDDAGLVDALSGLDAAASALGPFYRFERPLAAAAIAAGVPYASICDDHGAAGAVMELDAAARDRGVPVVTGLGWTPGLTNLAARRLYEELDELDTVRVFWAGAAADASGTAVVLHTLYAFDGFVPAVRQGLIEFVPAGTSPEPVRFPHPVGSVLTSYVGHPEPLTLPRFLRGVRRVDLKGGLAEGYLTAFTRVLCRAGLARTHDRRRRVVGVLGPLLPRLERLGGAVAASAWRVEGAGPGATGAYWGAGRMRDLTGVPLALGALLLARGEVDAPGVLAPEADGFPHQRLWDLLSAHGIRADAVPQP
jgi:lysine 6-dehydrogenase